MQPSMCPLSTGLRWGARTTICTRLACKQPLHGHQLVSRCIRTRSVVESHNTGFWTIEQPVKYEDEVKKSKFIVFAWPITKPSQALDMVKQHRDPGASHNCWAYRLGDEFRSSDDGEPGGTAGRPILSAVEGEGLDGVCVMVTRYFGGVKLGAGGLVRAYGGAARDCLKLAPRVFVKAKATLTLTASFDVLGAVYNALDKFGCERLSEEYLESGDVGLVLSVEQEVAQQVITTVSNATSGKVVPIMQIPTADS